jgi:GAF domain-containing protein
MYYGEGIRSLAVMPILSGGVCLGILLVSWRREGVISQESL